MSQIRVSHHTIIHDVAHVQNMWLWHLNLVYHTEHATFDLQSEPLLFIPRAGGGWIRFKDIHFEMRCSVPAPSLWVMRITRNFSVGDAARVWGFGARKNGVSKYLIKWG